jgi:hypothetical protein
VKVCGYCKYILTYTIYKGMILTIVMMNISQIDEGRKKTNIIKFIIYNSPQFLISVGYEDKYIEESVHTKFLGLQLNWKTDISRMVPKLSRACYAVRSLSQLSNIDILKLIYFAYFHSLMKYEIIFWGNSSDSKKVFTLQKNIVRIIVGSKPQTPSRDIFKKLQILPLPCEYIFSLLNFVINNLEHFQAYSAIHSVNTRNKHHVHRPIANLTYFQKTTYYSEIKIFNNLPVRLKVL